MMFSKFNLNGVEWLDLIFEDRNKTYGAYELRRNSGNYLLKALLVSTLFFVGLIIGPSVYYLLKNQQQVVNDFKMVDEDERVFVMEDIPVLKEQKLASVLEEESVLGSATTEVSNIKQVNYSRPKVVEDNLVKVEAPTIEEISASIIGNVNKDGELAAGAENSFTNGNSKTVFGDGNGEAATESIFETVEVMPQFPGGMAAWGKFLNKNLRYPEIASENNVQGKVYVSFVVEKDGSVTGLKILKGIGFGCDEEAIRVIKKSPFWKPGIQNGVAVRVSYVIPIVFQLN